MTKSYCVALLLLNGCLYLPPARYYCQGCDQRPSSMTIQQREMDALSDRNRLDRVESQLREQKMREWQK